MLARTGYEPRQSVSLRVPLTVFDWLITKSDEAEMPVATFIVKRLREMARQDLVKGSEVSDDHLSGSEAAR